MSAILVRETHAAYERLRRFVPLGVLRSEKDYRKAMAMLDEIIDERLVVSGSFANRTQVEGEGDCRAGLWSGPDDFGRRLGRRSE